MLLAATVGMVVEALAGGAFVQLMKPLVNDGFVHPKPEMAVLLPLAIVGLVGASSATCVNRFSGSTYACPVRVLTPNQCR